MKNRILCFGSLLLCLGLAGCVRAPQKVAPEIPSIPSVPDLEKTFGAVYVEPNQGLSLSFKNVRIGIDVDETQKNGPSDYYLFTENPFLNKTSDFPQYFKQSKIISTADSIDIFSQKGFSQVKALRHQQRLLLKKENEVVFVTAVQVVAEPDKKILNGYFLEFDNGRTILVSKNLTTTPSVREFLYMLRDDGREVNLLISADGLGPENSAVLAGLFQPNLMLIQAQKETPNHFTSTNEYKSQLSEQMFQGNWKVVFPNTEIPF